MNGFTHEENVTFICQMVQAKMYSYLNLPVCSLISTKNIKHENIINNQ